MAEVELEAFVLNDVDLLFPTDDYAASCSSATFTPSSSIVVFKGLKKGKSKSFPTDPTWTLDLEYAQDWKTDDSLSRYLYDHRGETIEGVSFTPTGGGTAWTADIVIAPGAIGGPVDTVATATVSLGVQGEPEPVDTP